MANAEAEQLLSKAMEALGHGHTHLSQACLEQAMHYEKTPQICSCLAYCLAINTTRFDEAIALGREALEAEPYAPLYCLNLGKVLLLAGRKEEAIPVLRQGLAFAKDDALIALLDELGTRDQPVFKSLPRSHFINKYSGLLLSRMGFR